MPAKHVKARHWIATDDWEGCLWVYCEYCASVGVKRER
jgi:hypothetical protein